MTEVTHLPLHRDRHKRHTLFYMYVLLLAGSLLCSAFTLVDADSFEHCGIGKFNCKDGSCIPMGKVCNSKFDCADQSDEVDCDSKMCHKPNWFQCTESNGHCLAAELVCNGIENCPYGEDERDCVEHKSVDSSRKGIWTSFDIGTGGWYSVQRECSTFEFTCVSDKACIPLDYMCDGKDDCHDRSDETDGCQKAEATCRGFFCGNKKCLPNMNWVCDGIDDCGDGSDERKCAFNCKLEEGNFACHNNETCVPLSKVCDKVRDCTDGSDEADSCTSPSNNCTHKTCPPASKCQMLPHSDPYCVCPKGFRYSMSQNSCVDIDECAEKFGICSQHCENTSGGYKCTCDEAYTLHSDNKTCRAIGNEALLLYSTQLRVMGVHLRSQKVFTVAGNLTKVIGVAYDGEDVYWTNIQNNAESIVKSKVDGSEQEILLTSGLDAPEDLAVDWLTGNIYFSDNVQRHIAACSGDGLTCNVLVTIDVDQPRGIALWPQRGQMFWTDWGTKPMIARASMDGANSLAIVKENIHWPNGVTLDLHGDRLYWVDAKLSILESVRIDGSDRRVILDKILRHPYGVAIFEDTLYWSDWGSRAIHSCNKFTGKGHKVLTKDITIYAVHIYHSSKQPKTHHACMNTRCSHMCLLAENGTYTCACPEGMHLSVNRQRCVKTYKRQRLFIGVRNTILEIEHTTFGRHVISKTHHVPAFISEMTYNSVNGTIIIADNLQQMIFEFDLTTNKAINLTEGILGNVTGMAFDPYAYNVYWTDAAHKAVEVLSMHTRKHAIISFFSGLETPIGLAIAPEEGVMFVALRSRNHVHLDQIPLSGQGEHTHVFEDELGFKELKFVSDHENNRFYWSDSDLGRISFSDFTSLHAYSVLRQLKRPFSLAIIEDDIFWSELRSATIQWTHIGHKGPVKHFEIEMAKDTVTHMLPAQLPLLASTARSIVDHPCQHGNGGCSHICINLGKFSGVCKCPPRMEFKDSSNRTCIESEDCEFTCNSGECLTESRHCNGHRDCADGSDEKDCDGSKTKAYCTIGQFACHNSEQCVSKDRQCDGKKDCKDGSDEDHCEKFDARRKCHHHQFACDNGRCVDFSTMCDGNDDCGDYSDENRCKKGNEKAVVCDRSMFQCNSGTCIAKSWECDGKIDCSDGSDEHDKCGLKECPSKMHKCLLGQCIDERLVCDGHNDCGDHSDEMNCDGKKGKKHKIACGDAKHPKYQCASNEHICLELSAKCNGTAECPRGEDEAECSGICSIYEFQCKDKECIRREFRCDHDKDCADGSDEHDCHTYHNSTDLIKATHEQICEKDMFDCKDGQCIDKSRMCDGFEDCDSGADESPQCELACRVSSGRPVCQHKCHATPSGAVCSCLPGYKLEMDRRTCVDVNECEEQDPCAQLCENTHGSYRCSCYPDFMLRIDKTSCKSIESDFRMMFSTYNEVRSMSMSPITLRVAWAANDSKIAGFDLNVRQRKAYFTTDSEDILYAIDLNTGNVMDALAVEMPSKVAVDWITDNVYVISRSKRYTIKICSFDAKMCGKIFEANPRETIKALAFDALNRKLFYAVVRTLAFSDPVSQISVSTPDGRKRETLINRKMGFITAITADPFKRMLYYVDSHSRTLEVVSYKAGSSRLPTTLKQKEGVIMHPSGLTLYENHAYFVNVGAKEAVRCELFGSRNCNAVNLNILNAEDIVIDGASRQPLAINHCDMAKCAGMCLQAEHGYECMCGDLIVSESVACPKMTSNAIVASALLLKSAAEPHKEKSHSTAAIILCVLFVGLLVCAVGYLYYSRFKQSHHRDFNINLHFQNPLSSKAKSSKTTTEASFDYNREKIQPIRRVLRNSTTFAGTEIILEPSSNEFSTIEQTQHIPSLMVDLNADYYASSTNGNYASDDDDARTRLVP